MSLRTVQLEEVAEVVQGGRHKLSGNNFAERGFPAYGAGGMNGYLATFEFEEDAVVLSSIGARCGKCFFASGKWSSLANTQVIRPDPKLADARFLWFLLDDEERWPRSGTGQPFIKPSDVKGHKIPLPDLPEQKRIAGLLEQADRLRRTRRYALELSDTFLPAAFLQLFGDPIENPQKFPVSRLEDELATIESGSSPVCDGPRSSPEQWAVLGLGSVTTGDFLPTENKSLPAGVEPDSTLEVRNNDVLVTRKNTYELVAASALVRRPPPRLLLPDTIFRFVPKTPTRVLPEFLWGTLSSVRFKRKVQRLAAGSAGSMPGISKEKFMTVAIPVPPLAHQHHFAALVAQHERQRANQREALRQAEHLFQSLLHRAFTTGL